MVDESTCKNRLKMASDFRRDFMTAPSTRQWKMLPSSSRTPVTRRVTSRQIKGWGRGSRLASLHGLLSTLLWAASQAMAAIGQQLQNGVSMPLESVLQGIAALLEDAA